MIYKYPMLVNKSNTDYRKYGNHWSGNSSLKKVFLVSHNSNLSGAPVSLLQLARILPDFGFYPLFILPKSGPIQEMIKSSEVNFIILKRPRVVSFIKMILKEKPLLVHINSVVNTWPVLISRMFKKPVVWHVREYLGRKKYYARLIHFLANRVILISKEQFKLFSGMKKAVFIPNGVDIKIYEDKSPSKLFMNYESNVFIKEKKLSSHSDFSEKGRKRTVICFIGSIEPRKGLMVLVRAAELLKEMKDIYFFIVGDAKGKYLGYKAEVLRYIEKKNLYNMFYFLGYRSDIPGILAASDILCHPALTEVFGRVVIEAMAAGLPVVATKVGEMREIVEDGKTGLLVPPEDHVALAMALKSLIVDKKSRTSMGIAGRERVKRKYNIKLHAKRVSEVYVSLLLRKS
ncbi:MAG: glycosyltransferase family 4 protein [Candidatus Jordarchaeum sp.]|uniref:glycosyltransferase family 4 protein n=1 Tax=Candidatus Jordarchaeum sp. TaxID=2823881 RepID=UPI00404AC3EC